MRYPKPLQPGDRIGVTAPSSGVHESLRDRVDVCVARLADLGYDVVLGDCFWSSSPVSAPADERAAELTRMLADPSIAAVLTPWGGELGITVVDRLDWAALDRAEPTWFIGPSDVTTLTLALTVRLDWATIHANGLMATPFQVPDGVWRWHEVAASDGEVLQRSPGRHRSPAEFVDLVGAADRGDPEASVEGRWRVVGGGPLDVSGRLVGGCIETISSLAGTPYGDLPRFGRTYDQDGLVVYLEASEEPAFTIARQLYGMRLAGWFDRAQAVLIGRTDAPDEEHLTQDEAVLQSLGDLGVPIVLDVECGHVQPRMPFVNGSVARVVVDGERCEITQRWA